MSEDIPPTSAQEMGEKIRYHALKLVRYVTDRIGNHTMAIAILSVVVKDTIAKIRTKNGDAYTQNVLNGFLAEFQAGGWVPIRGGEELATVNKQTGGVLYQSTGIINAFTKEDTMDDPVWYPENHDDIQMFLLKIHLPCWYHPVIMLPGREVPLDDKADT